MCLCAAGRLRQPTRDRICHRRSVFDDGTVGKNTKEAPVSRRRRPKQIPPPHRNASPKCSAGVGAGGNEGGHDAVGREKVVAASARASTRCLVEGTGSPKEPRLLPPPKNRTAVFDKSPSCANGSVSKAVQQHEEKAATVIQIAVRGKLVRKFRLASLAAHEQHRAVEHLRARGHLTNAGKEILRSSPRRGNWDCGTSRSTTQAVYC